MQLHDNRLSTLKAYALKQIARGGYTEQELVPTYRWLTQDLLDLSSTQMMLADDTRLSESEILRALMALKEIRKGIPLQYVIGHCEFYGRRFKSDSRALIPRPETEELIAWILETPPRAGELLDIGTGTGCIAITLACELPQTEVSAMDVSSDALALSSENAKAIGSSLKLHCDDILKPSKDYPQYDLIVSNPPYVKENERTLMHERVLAHEPDLALFVPDEDALRFYSAIAVFAKEQLKPNGELYLEINEALGQETLSLLASTGFLDCELREDINGKDRMIKCRWRP